MGLVRAPHDCALVLFLIVYVLVRGSAECHLGAALHNAELPHRLASASCPISSIRSISSSRRSCIVLPLGRGRGDLPDRVRARTRSSSRLIEYAAETLSGIPSIIYGLVGMLFFCQFLGMQTSLLAGALTLVIMNLPTDNAHDRRRASRPCRRATARARSGSGAGKWRVIRTVVLPGCVDGVITGCILSVGRILGESCGAAVHGGLCPHAATACSTGLGQRGRDADRRPLCLRQGGGRV